MREKLQTLPLTELKELAKSQGMKGLSGMKKSEIIELLCRRAQEMDTQKASQTESDGNTQLSGAAGMEQVPQAGNLERSDKVLHREHTRRAMEPENLERTARAAQPENVERTARAAQPENAGRN